jgi:tetratricopeptide (TPR) repeat protein
LTIALPFVAAQTSTHTAASGNAATGSTVTSAQKVYLQTEAAFILNHDEGKAREGFLRVVRIDPRYAPAWFNLGVLAESDKNWVKAESYFRRYLELAPKGPDAKRAREQMELLPKYAAGTITPEAARSAEYDAAIHRARVFLSAGHFREAIAEAGNAQAMDASRWEAYAVVSLCMARQNKTQEANKFADLAVSHAPAGKQDQVRAVLASSTGSEAPR